MLKKLFRWILGKPAYPASACQDCGSTFFLMAPLVATARDGRSFIFGADPRFPYIMGFRCFRCDARYIFPDKMRSKGALLCPTSKTALDLILQDAPDVEHDMSHQQVEVKL